MSAYMEMKQQFEDFIAAYLDSAHKLAKIYVETFEDAEDVVSESIERALRGIHMLDHSCHLKPWFNKIIINTSINYLKKQAQGRVTHEVKTAHYMDDFSQLDFEDLIGILPETEREILTLRFCDRMELQDIASALQLNENTVKTKLYRSLRKLELKIQTHDDRVAIAVNARRSKAKILGVTLAVTVLAASFVFNLSPALAIAAYDLPVIGSIVRVITFNRFAYEYNNSKADINLPQIQGLLDKELQDKLNAEFGGFADNLIRSFEMSTAELIECGDESAYMSIKADYAVKTDNDHILAIDAYLYSDTNGLTLHKFVTIDKQTGRLVTLPGLFEEDTDYITPISAYLLQEMTRINVEEGGAFWVEDGLFPGMSFREIRPDHNFYLNDSGTLVICFDKYEVAPGYKGSPEFVIPTEVIQDILASGLIT